MRYLREQVLDVQNVRALTHASMKQSTALAMVTQTVSVERLIKELRKKGCRPDEDEVTGTLWKGGGRREEGWFTHLRAIPFLSFCEGRRRFRLR